MAAIIIGDAIEVLSALPDEFVDAVITDPPYELGFMGKKWDGTGIAHTPEVWRECCRVLKPGGHLLSFGGTRTYHRMASAVEDAGFEIRDMVQWLYGQGFPKSMNVGKALDQWMGWGTALKPACEPIVLARKPFRGTVANNVLAHCTGALNIDGTRVAHSLHQEGRWPANVILTHHPECELVGTKTVGSGETKLTEFSQPNIRGNAYNSTETKQTAIGVQYGAEEVEAWECVEDCPVDMLDKQSGVKKPHEGRQLRRVASKNAATGTSLGGSVDGSLRNQDIAGFDRGDGGGASRFFYTAKASKSERNAGLDTKNNHPTVKPVALMRYLVRLITPPDGLILDPFIGSGTTGIAAVLEGFRFLGIEKEPEYVTIANARIDHWTEENDLAATG